MKTARDTFRGTRTKISSLSAWFRSQGAVLMLCRAALAFSWIYQGAVPKLVCMSSGELELLGHLIPVYRWACIAVSWMGVGEILFGFWLFVTSRPLLFRLNIAALLLLLLFVALFEPQMLLEPFNPFTLNAALVALSAIAVIELQNTQNAKHDADQHTR
ncbi:DoxX-like family protein [Chlorobium sp. N1]|uniref:DoxX-like family protein n=1 Tax=Chlorobium sp. N1 TaxID=2491138 RepID=UPI00104044A9|nr:DoxX-like family protein [Chlorobium sp. N1]TCD48431.1 hypothetical protein E0L29_00640 [Chlorobium sp. N1]